MKLMSVAVAALLTLGVAAGCGSDDTDTATGAGTEATDTIGNSESSESSESSEAKVTVSGQWARTSPAGAENGAIYMTLRSEDGDTLTGAAVDTSVAAKTEIHETMASMPGTSTTGAGGGTGSTMAGSGMMSMKPVAELELPKGTDVALEPGGYHIMLLDLAKPLATGEKLTVTLTFAEAGTMEVEVPVRDSAP